MLYKCFVFAGMSHLNHCLLDELSLYALHISSCSEEVCFPPCGCFDDRGPFEKRPLPLGPGNGSDIIWTLFTQLSQNEELLITFKDDTWDVP